MAQEIPLLRLAIAFIPAIIAIGIIVLWAQNYKSALHGMLRMLIQLLGIGYVLTYIFTSDSPWVILLVLTIMIAVSSWISLRTITQRSWRLYQFSLISIVLSGGFTLWVVTQGVLAIEPWYSPQFMIPLAGMIFSNSMTSISLAAERFYAEREHGASYADARNIAFQAALIPVINSLFAVGVVSLPGMMTGQILSGVSPLIAVRYQIMVMSMLFGSTTIAVACFLMLLKNRKEA